MSLPVPFSIDIVSHCRMEGNAVIENLHYDVIAWKSFGITGPLMYFGLMWAWTNNVIHYTDVIMTTMASQIASLTVVYSTVYSDADQRKHQSSASLAFVKGFHLMTSSWPTCPWFESSRGSSDCNVHKRLYFQALAQRFKSLCRYKLVLLKNLP